jgi:homoserine kinase
VSGYHADNVAPSLLGGFVLIRSYEPLEIFQIPFHETEKLFFILVSPDFEAPTEKMRKVLPKEVSPRSVIIIRYVFVCKQS